MCLATIFSFLYFTKYEGAECEEVKADKCEVAKCEVAKCEEVKCEEVTCVGNVPKCEA